MTTEFRRGSAWNGSKIGWFWGGMTVQGVLPYYYNLITAKGRAQIVDRCTYYPFCLFGGAQSIIFALFTTFAD